MGLFDKLRDKKDKNDNVEKELDSTEVKEDVVADAGIDEDELLLILVAITIPKTLR